MRKDLNCSVAGKHMQRSLCPVQLPYLADLKETVDSHAKCDHDLTEWEAYRYDVLWRYNYRPGGRFYCRICEETLYHREYDEYNRCELYLTNSRTNGRWRRKWAHALCIKDYYVKWVDRGAYLDKHVDKMKWWQWKRWLRECVTVERCQYLLADSGHNPFVNNGLKSSLMVSKALILNLHKHSVPFEQEPLSDIIQKKERGANALLCLLECGLPWDMAWSIAALAYWVLDDDWG
jgi:hypothetical protein